MSESAYRSIGVFVDDRVPHHFKQYLMRRNGFVGNQLGRLFNPMNNDEFSAHILRNPEARQNFIKDGGYVLLSGGIPISEILGLNVAETIWGGAFDDENINSLTGKTIFYPEISTKAQLKNSPEAVRRFREDETIRVLCGPGYSISNQSELELAIQSLNHLGMPKLRLKAAHASDGEAQIAGSTTSELLRAYNNIAAMTASPEAVITPQLDPIAGEEAVRNVSVNYYNLPGLGEFFTICEQLTANQLRNDGTQPYGGARVHVIRANLNEIEGILSDSTTNINNNLDQYAIQAAINGASFLKLYLNSLNSLVAASVIGVDTLIGTYQQNDKTNLAQFVADLRARVGGPDPFLIRAIEQMNIANANYMQGVVELIYGTNNHRPIELGEELVMCYMDENNHSQSLQIIIGTCV